LVATLRERNRERARRGIQAEALRLFLDQGYDATTTRQIAEASGVSPATLFRYFPGKDDILFSGPSGPEDLLLAKAFADRSAEESALDAVAGAVVTVFGQLLDEDADPMRTRLQLIYRTPPLRARQLVQNLQLAESLAGLVAGRLGLPADDFGVEVLASSASAVVATAVRVWATSEDPDVDLLALLEDGFAQLRGGFA
jgi:AcrR family transcriptional regulator